MAIRLAPSQARVVRPKGKTSKIANSAARPVPNVRTVPPQTPAESPNNNETRTRHSHTRHVCSGGNGPTMNSRRFCVITPQRAAVKAQTRIRLPAV